LGGRPLRPARLRLRHLRSHPREGGPEPVWTKLFPSQEVDARAAEEATEQMRRHCQSVSPGDPCTPPRIVVQPGVSPRYVNDSRTFYLDPGLLNPTMRPAVAREMAQAWYPETRGCQHAAAARCERRANALAVDVLAIGYDTPREEAVSAVWEDAPL